MTASASEQHEMGRLKHPVEDENQGSNRPSHPKKKNIKKEETPDKTTSIKQEELFASSSIAINRHARSRTQYGAAIPVTASGTFPQAGSILGPYFCLGTLGKGTFSSIHKCINLDYAHSIDKKTNNCRLAAAKVELSTFANSGVLLGEAMVLHFLDEALPKGTVPVYMGHYTASGGEGDDSASNNNASSTAAPTAAPLAAAIAMEYLPGEDMHQLRENRNALSPSGKAPRRLTIDDAVYLTADVMLPLLERMHKVGIVHRDVKPSNCVRSQGRKFCMVDFGLSKSIVVPPDSTFADRERPWPEGQPWLVPPSDSNPASRGEKSKSARKTWQPGCYRKERSSADFRGTSMYASPRVHQKRDYCPRDDVWSLLYVFCDLVSGGLPWMSHAANRDRDMCQKVKEQVHGLTPPENGGTAAKDETEQLLMGDDYHVAMFKLKQREANNAAASADTPLPALPEPLEMSKDKTKIQLLQRAFAHLAKLQFWEQPDYALITRCIRGFLDEEGAVGEADDIEIEWTEDNDGRGTKSSRRRKREREMKEDPDVPMYEFVSETSPDPEMDEDPLVNSELFEGLVAAPEQDTQTANGNVMSESATAVRRLPLEQQFRIAQMEYHANNPKTALPHIVLRDWMKVAIPLLYKDWDSKAYESGGHRTFADGYRREFYLELVEKCIKWATCFDYFSKKTYLSYDNGSQNGLKIEEGEDGSQKKRQIESTFGNLSSSSNGESLTTDLVAVSKVIFGLQCVSRSERAKSFAPPPLLSFGPSR